MTRDSVPVILPETTVEGANDAGPVDRDNGLRRRRAGTGGDVTAPTDGLIKATTSGSGFSVPMATIYEGSPGSLTQVGCRGDVVAVRAGVTYYLRLSLPGCCPGTFTLDVTVPAPPANDLIENATPITTLPFTATQDSADATSSSTDPSSACIGGVLPTVWYSFTTTTDGLIEAGTTGGFSTFLTIYEGQPGSLSQVTCTFGAQSVTVPVTKGTTYYLSVVPLQHDTFTLDVTELLNISLPPDVTAEATGPFGATVDYVVSASLPDGSPAPIDCAPASGSVLPVGLTTITCTASDDAGNTATGSFVVHVVDTTAPSVTVPANVSVDATHPFGAAVTYTVSATDIVDLAPTITCDPPSGASFAIGDTTVSCGATDFSGNSGPRGRGRGTARVRRGAYQPGCQAATRSPRALRRQTGNRLWGARGVCPRGPRPIRTIDRASHHHHADRRRVADSGGHRLPPLTRCWCSGYNDWGVESSTPAPRSGVVSTSAHLPVGARQPRRPPRNTSRDDPPIATRCPNPPRRGVEDPQPPCGTLFIHPLLVAAEPTDLRRVR